MTDLEIEQEQAALEQSVISSIADILTATGHSVNTSGYYWNVDGYDVRVNIRKPSQYSWRNQAWRIVVSYAGYTRSRTHATYNNLTKKNETGVRFNYEKIAAKILEFAVQEHNSKMAREAETRREDTAKSLEKELGLDSVDDSGNEGVFSTAFVYTSETLRLLADMLDKREKKDSEFQIKLTMSEAEIRDMAEALKKTKRNRQNWWL